MSGKDRYFRKDRGKTSLLVSTKSKSKVHCSDGRW